MGKVITYTKKSFGRDKIGERLASDFERRCTVAGMKVDRVEDTQYIIITAQYETRYDVFEEYMEESDE